MRTIYSKDVAFTIVLLIGSVGVLGTSRMGRLGARQKIPGAQNDLQLEDLAKFAVEQHNEKQNSDLRYVSLVSAEQQVVTGIMYYLDLEAAIGNDTRLYEAKVWVKPWENSKSLEDFEEKQSSSASAQTDINIDSVDPASTSSKVNMGMQPVSSNDAMVREAAEHAIKVIQERSNSLVPYELDKISSAHVEITEESRSYALLLSVRRGSKVEQFDADVTRTDDGRWSVKDVHLHH